MLPRCLQPVNSWDARCKTRNGSGVGLVLAIQSAVYSRYASAHANVLGWLLPETGRLALYAWGKQAKGRIGRPLS
jgi:hypothetical protein